MENVLKEFERSIRYHNNLVLSNYSNEAGDLLEKLSLAIEQLLCEGFDDNGVKVLFTEDHVTLLFLLACELGDSIMADRLLSYNPDVNAQDQNGNTALIRACLDNNIDIVKLLITIQKIDLNIKNHNDETALTIACYKGYEDLALLLISKDSNPDGKGMDTQEIWDAYENLSLLRPMDLNQANCLLRNYSQLNSDIYPQNLQPLLLNSISDALTYSTKHEDFANNTSDEEEFDKLLSSEYSLDFLYNLLMFFSGNSIIKIDIDEEKLKILNAALNKFSPRQDSKSTNSAEQRKFTDDESLMQIIDIDEMDDSLSSTCYSASHDPIVMKKKMLGAIVDLTSEKEDLEMDLEMDCSEPDICLYNESSSNPNKMNDIREIWNIYENLTRQKPINLNQANCLLRNYFQLDSDIYPQNLQPLLLKSINAASTYTTSLEESGEQLISKNTSKFLKNLLIFFSGESSLKIEITQVELEILNNALYDFSAARESESKNTDTKKRKFIGNEEKFGQMMMDIDESDNPRATICCGSSDDPVAIKRKMVEEKILRLEKDYWAMEKEYLAMKDIFSNDATSCDLEVVGETENQEMSS